MIETAYNVIIKPIAMFLAKHSPLILGIIANTAVVIIICKLIDAFEIKLENRIKDKNSDSPLLNLMPILVKVLKAIIIFILLASFLQSFGYNVSSLIAGFGITGLAVGFAAKEAIGNVFGSLGLLGDRVYKIGDYIKFDNLEGYVEKINLRSTSIRTFDDFIVNVPNNTIANEAITNVSKSRRRLIDITIGIEYGTPNEKIDKAIEILKDISKNSDSIIGDGVYAAIDKLDDSSINVRMFAYTKEKIWAKYKVVKGDIINKIIHRFREEGINFAFPSTSVYIEKTGKEQ